MRLRALILLCLAGCFPLPGPSKPFDAGPPADALQLVRGEIYEGGGPAEREVRASIRLHNSTSMPLGLQAQLFKLRLSTGVEIMGSQTATLGIPSACPNGDVSVGAMAECSVAFTVDAFHLYEQGTDEVWRPVHTFELTGG